MYTEKHHTEWGFYMFLEENLEYLKYVYRNMPHNNKIDFNKFLNFCYKLS